MTHVYTRAVLIGEKGKRELGELLVDTGATFTVLPSEILKGVGAYLMPTKTKLELGDGRTMAADVYAAVITVGDREASTSVVTFKDAKPVLCVRTLEDLGLKVNPVDGTLEPTRPPGVAYYYSSE